MPRTAVVLAVAGLLALSLLPPATGLQRSFVGKKLPVFDYVDTEGHTIQPKFYEGSVLVVFGGIPW